MLKEADIEITSSRMYDDMTMRVQRYLMRERHLNQTSRQALLVDTCR